MKSRTAGEQIFNLLEFYLKEKGPPSDRDTNVCSAGAKSVAGRLSTFISCVKVILSDIVISCCVIHGHAVVVKET